MLGFSAWMSQITLTEEQQREVEETEKQNEKEDETVSQLIYQYLLKKITPKEFYCTKRCTTGCVKCICSRSGEQCGSKCGCTIEKCKNRTEPEDPLADWKNDDFIPQSGAEFEANKCGGQNVPPTQSPYQIFMLMFSSFLGHIFQDTISYAMKTGCSKLEYRILTLDNICCYFLVIFAMGLVQYPTIQDYWKRDDPIFGNGVPYIQALLTLDQFWVLNKYVHCEVEVLVALMNSTFRSFWIPFQYIVVDESIIAFKGRFHGRQTIPTKPNSTGKSNLFIVS